MLSILGFSCIKCMFHVCVEKNTFFLHIDFFLSKDYSHLTILIISELQIIFESNAYLRPNFLLNADFQIFRFQKVFSPPVIFRKAERGGITVLKCRIWNFNYSFGSDLLLLVITLEYILTIFWQYVDKRTDRLTSTIRSFTFVLRHVLTISMHCIGHLMCTPIC